MHIPKFDPVTERFAIAYHLVSNGTRKVNRAILHYPNKIWDAAAIQKRRAWIREHITWEGLVFFTMVFVGYATAVFIMACIVAFNIFFSIILLSVWAPLGYAWAASTGVGVALWIISFTQSIALRRATTDGEIIDVEVFSTPVPQVTLTEDQQPRPDLFTPPLSTGGNPA